MLAGNGQELIHDWFAGLLGPKLWFPGTVYMAG